MTLKSDSVTWRAFLGSGHTGALLLVCLAVWLHAADSLLVATMLPSIVTDIGGAAYISWSVSIYEIGSVVAGAASALLSMRYGLRVPMGGAALLFGAGCAISALAPTMAWVLLGRVFQGLGGGGLVTLGFVAAGVLFPKLYRARVIAVVSAFWGMSAFLGPLLGGLFVEYATWRVGFGVFAVQALALALWIFSRGARGEALVQTSTDVAANSSFPLWRLALLCVAVVAISAAGVRVELWRTTILIALGVLCLWQFLRRDAAAADSRLLPPAPMDPRTPVGAALLMLLLISMGTIAVLAYGPILMTTLHGISALTAGYVLACSTIGWTFSAIVFSGAPERQDRYWIAAGMGLTAASVAGFAYALPQGPVALIALFSFVEGLGFGMAWTFILRRITALAPTSEAARVSGALPTVQRIGYALGAAYVGIVANAAGFLEIGGPRDAADVAWVMMAASVPLVLGAVLAMTQFVRRTPYDDTL